MFMVYSAGNFIEATEETPYFQIGETKYGKPVLDRMIAPETSLVTAAKAMLISFDSTMRSSASVGTPIDLLALPKDDFEGKTRQILDQGDPYLTAISEGWSEGLRRAFMAVPDPQLFATDENGLAFRHPAAE